MEINCTVNVMDNNLTVCCNVLECNCALAASEEDTSCYMNVFHVKVAVTHAICHNKVALNYSIVDKHVLTAYKNSALKVCICVGAGLAYVSIYYVIENLCNLCTCYVSSGAESFILVTVKIIVSYHCVHCTYCPGVNVFSVRKRTKLSTVAVLKHKHSCKG